MMGKNHKTIQITRISGASFRINKKTYQFKTLLTHFFSVHKYYFVKDLSHLTITVAQIFVGTFNSRGDGCGTRNVFVLSGVDEKYL